MDENDKPKRRPTAPFISPRPKSREQGLAEMEQRSSNSEEERRMQEALGDVEFRADLEPQLSWNALARLGYDTNVKTMPYDIGGNSFYAATFGENDDPKAIQKYFSNFDQTGEHSSRVGSGSIVAFNHSAQAPIISHEMTHRGFAKILDFYKKDPEFFEKEFGEKASDWLNGYINSPNQNRRQESLLELLDDYEARLVKPDGTITDMSDTHDTGPSTYFKREQEQTQERLKGDRGRWGTPFANEVVLGLDKAAQYLLKQQGEPSKTEPDYPNWLERTFGIRFARGGLAEKHGEEQMIERDPVSGNEVPIGANPKEVRDDIDAKLSDGEYVLPADVVRYFGVQHIERMVQKAKEGMMEMASNGRINGQDPRQQAVPPGGPNGGPPSDDPTVRKFAGGGYNTEYQFAPQPTMPGDAPIAMDGYSAAEELRRRQEAPVQMADGGYAAAEKDILGGSLSSATSNILNPNNSFSFGPGYGGSRIGTGNWGAGGGVTTQTYINSAGERMSIMFINGTPLSDIPDGFFPDNEETRKMFAEQNTRGEDVADPSQQWDEDGRDSAESNGRNKVDPYSTADTNPFTMSPEQALERAQELAKTAAGGGIMEGLGKVPGTIGAVAGTLGKVGQVNAYNELQALKTAIDKRGGLGINESIDALIEEVASDVPTPKRESGFITPTDKFYEKFETGLTGVPYQSVVDNYPAIVNEHTGQPTTPTGTTSGGTTGGAGPTTGGQGPVTTPVNSPTPTSGLSFGSGYPAGQTGVRASDALGFGRTEAPRVSYEDTLKNNNYLAPGTTGVSNMPSNVVDRNRSNNLPTNFNARTVSNLGTDRARAQEAAGGGAEDRRADAAAQEAQERARETSSRQATEALGNFDRNVESARATADAAEARGDTATAQSIRSEIDRVRESLENRARGGTTGFAKGGLVSRPNMQRKSYRKIRTVQK